MHEVSPKPQAFSTECVLALAVTAGWGLFLAGFQRLATVGWVADSLAAGMVVVGVCFLGAIAGLGLLARLKVRAWALLLMTGAWGAMYVLLVTRHFPEASFFWAATYGVPLLKPFPRLLCQIIFNLFLFSAGATGGRLLSRLVEDPRYLIPVVIVISLADTWSVLAGPTRTLQEERPDIIAKVAVSLPQPQTGNLVPAVGVTDVLFIGFFLTLAARFNMGMWRGSFGIVLGLTVALGLLTLGHTWPGLPFIGGGFVAMQWRRVKPRKKELLTTMAFVVVMSAVMAAITLMQRSRSAAARQAKQEAPDRHDAVPGGDDDSDGGDRSDAANPRPAPETIGQ